MRAEIRDLIKYRKDDLQKINMMADVLKTYYPNSSLYEGYMNKSDITFDNKLCYSATAPVLSKICPKCGRKYSGFENVCFDCLCYLKNISGTVDVNEIKYNPQFIVEGDNSFESFESLLSDENLTKIREFKFSYQDYLDVVRNIKSVAFKNFDDLIKTGEVDFDSLDIKDKIILFAKSFVNINYKSSGHQLGYFESNTIYIDDRQTKYLEITTVIHELSHFLIQEILVEILCRLLDASKNRFIEDIIVYILSYSPFTQLIDEYAAHNVEGRFTIFGFQDYSSYEQIEKSLNGQMTVDEIEITKSIGNTFAVSLKDILESLIDRDLREEIKNQFFKDNFDRPNYDVLKIENCQILNDEGFIKALWLILNDGCENARFNYLNEG